MKLSPQAQMKLVAVLATGYLLLGCEAPASSAVEQVPPVYPVASTVAAPDLVTVSTVTNVAVEPAPAAPIPAGEPTAGDPPRAPVALSSALQEVVKLAQSGVGDDVILAYIQNSPTAFSPTPDEILYLTDLGISDVVVTALVNHHSSQPQVAAQPAPAPAANGPTAMAAPTQAAPIPAEATYNPEPPMVYGAAPVVEYATPPPAVEYSSFYSSLSPYGAWVEVPDYGWCWQPTVAVIQYDWRPYCHHGRWLYTDCGYYWQSDYSWGWAPFHYGRWFHHPGRGWCWRPDSVWGPAWVSWRYTDAHCGWAPLPPGARYHSGVGFTYYGAHVSASFGFGLHGDAWTFVPAHRFHEHEVWRHSVPRAEHGRVFRESRVANNYTGHDNVIVNRGVADHVPALARTEPRKMIVRDMPERAGASIRPDRLGQEGAQTVVYRPKLPVSNEQNVRGGATPGRTVASRPNSVVRPGANSMAGGAASAEAPTGGPSASFAGSRGGVTDSERGSTASAGGSGHRPASRPTGAPQTEVSTPSTVRALNASPLSSRTEPARSPASDMAVQSPGTTVTAPGATRPTLRPGSPVGTPAARPAGNSTIPAPNPSAAGGAAYQATRQELAKPSVSAASGRYTGATPASAYQAPRPEPASSFRSQNASSVGSRPQADLQSSQPTPSWTASAQNTPARPPLAVQSRPSQPYSAPVVPSQPTASYASPAGQSRPAQSYSTPANPARSVSSFPAPAAQPQPAPSYSAPAVQPRSIPSYSAPAPQFRPAPSYSAPAVQSRPAQSYSAPAGQARPAPTYSAPAVQSRPAQVAPSYSAPASRPAPQSVPSSGGANRRQF
jgi:hypothetical protein